MTHEVSGNDHSGAGRDRRSFLERSSTAAMLAGLVGSYGTFAWIGGRFLYPARDQAHAWRFVARAADMKPGDSLSYRAPDGARLAVARMKDEGTADDFVALSSICPHLGCQVHWEGHNDRFFCPCHNGVFSPDGKPVSGPPAEASQSLKKFPLKLENGLLYIEVPVTLDRKAERDAGPIEDDEAPPGPGHDPCLFPDLKPRSV